MDISLVISAFISGLITFLAPCTLPLVPGYLGFISGVSTKDLQDTEKVKYLRKKVFLNGVFYVLGFSAVFIFLGTIFGLAGTFLAEYRIWLARIGGVFVIFFGLYLMHIFDFKWFAFLQKEKRLGFIKKLVPGKPSSSLIFGMTFAFGWTPCVGPILGSILLLASTKGTIFEGAFLLLIFSLGLAIPFLLMALIIGHATYIVRRISKYLKIIAIIGGALLVFLGFLLLTDSLGIFISIFYDLFEFINYEDRLIDFL